MAVCNLFNDLTNTSGNFLMFSQYVEDLTHNISESDNYKVAPSRFIAMDIDYSKFNPYMQSIQTISVESELNKSVPEFFQNYFENSCAYCRKNLKNTDELLIWNALNSKNLFWNSMFMSNLLTYTEDTEFNTNYVNEIVYGGDINMHSYNEHQGMGYGEIYCYIPSHAKKNSYSVHITSEYRNAIVNPNTVLEGFSDKSITDYSNIYYYNNDYEIDYSSKKEFDDSSYNINTIVVLYSIYSKNGDGWSVIYDDIPMGIYFTGKFINNDLTNTVKKYVTTSFDSGTSYGLRICTRFTATSNGGVIITDTNTVDDTNYTNLCQLMTKMNENLNKMLEVTKSSISENQGYKDILSIIKNNRYNVPYIKRINGEDFWFVNGKLISSTKTSAFLPLPKQPLDELNFDFTWDQ